MVSMLRGLLILAVLAGMLWPRDAFGQSAPPADAATETLPTPPRPLESPPANALPAPPSLPPLPGPLPSFAADGDGPFQENGVLGPPGQVVGWFANIDAGLIKPHIDSHVTSGSNLSATFANPITLPIAPLNWTGSPVVRLGYRFADGAGDVRLDWRMVASQGTDTIANFDAAGDGILKSRVNVQKIDLTYGISQYLTNAPNRTGSWAARLGISAADVFFDSQARGQQILQQRASSSFGGFGLPVMFQFHKPLGQSRVNLYGDVDATGLIGFTRQHFSETAVGSDGGLLHDAVDLRRQSNGIGILGVEGGFSYAPWDDRLCRFTFGYQWQRWWFLGATDDSNASLTLQGFFFRGEWRY